MRKFTPTLEKKKEQLQQIIPLMSRQITILKCLQQYHSIYGSKQTRQFDKEFKTNQLTLNKLLTKISNVQGIILQDILTQKYVLGYSLEVIAENLHYSPRHIQRLHLKALEIIDI